VKEERACDRMPQQIEERIVRDPEGDPKSRLWRAGTGQGRREGKIAAAMTSYMVNFSAVAQELYAAEYLSNHQRSTNRAPPKVFATQGSITAWWVNTGFASQAISCSKNAPCSASQ
jgi:hypothetical protein